MFEYDVESARAVEELDKHDLTIILRGIHDVDVYEIIDLIYNTKNIEIINAIECLTIDELIIYLERRYKMKSIEKTTTFMYWVEE